jgi:hypothetical protein
MKGFVKLQENTLIPSRFPIVGEKESAIYLRLNNKTVSDHLITSYMM